MAKPFVNCWGRVPAEGRGLSRKPFSPNRHAGVRPSSCNNCGAAFAPFAPRWVHPEKPGIRKPCFPAAYAWLKRKRRGHGPIFHPHRAPPAPFAPPPHRPEFLRVGGTGEGAFYRKLPPPDPARKRSDGRGGCTEDVCSSRNECCFLRKAYGKLGSPWTGKPKHGIG